MIPDDRTNFLYLADSLPKKYPNFYKHFEKVLCDCNIPFKLLPRTKDVWAVDYMPVQIEANKFVQFVYNPDYIRKYSKWRKTISDVNTICKKINITPQHSEIVLDGGNIIRTAEKVIMTDKVFNENPAFKEGDLINALQQLFQIEELIFIPTQPKDFTGHADGMLRFYDSNTVLVNDYSNEDQAFGLRLHLALHNAHINYIEIPYNPYNNRKDAYANGIYINYLQMEQAIIVPTFGIREDDGVIKKFEEYFKGKKIATINCNEIAYDGGILNCISWNILQ